MLSIWRFMNYPMLKKFIDKAGFHPPVYWNTFNFAPSHPAVGVSWHDAIAYAKLSGKRYQPKQNGNMRHRGRLVDKKYPWGNAEDDRIQANFTDKTINLKGQKMLARDMKHTARGFSY